MEKFKIKELEEYIVGLGEKKFHAKQIFKWIHKVGVVSFDEMTDSSKSLRDKLKENIEQTFFGASDETGWESVSSFYKKSSYNKLNLSLK